jgi:predicted nucleotidyltransferase
MLNLEKAIIDNLEKAQLLDKIDRVILFGSRARGDENTYSDVDLAFDSPNITQSDWLAIINVLEELPTLLKIDAVNYNEVSAELRRQIDLQGVIIYERN